MMKWIVSVLTRDIGVSLGICVALVLSLIVLRSIAPFVFPLYFVYIIGAVVIFFVLANIEFDILAAFSPALYLLSIFALILPIIFGEVTRGAVRWIPLGPITLQPAELVRPFLLLFFAHYLTSQKLTIPHIIKSFILLMIPLVLIFMQPSLGVTILTFVAIGGVVLALNYNKKLLIPGVGLMLLLLPLLWLIMAPYQKERVFSLLAPTSDPTGAGYNSIQSMIAVGSGKITGRGLGQGVQTQLSFLPERHTDFVFASISEELGFIGASLTLFLTFFLLFRLTHIAGNAISPAARAYASGAFVTLLLQSVVHIGMNMGMLPITGLPLPLISYGGSSLLATMMIYAIALSSKRQAKVVF